MKTMNMMNMTKAVKKLKLWTKKKRNKMERRTSTTTLIISSSGGGDCCPLLPMPWAEIETQSATEIKISSSSAYWAPSPSAAPSAPPLPPWLVLQHEHEDPEQRFNFAYPCPQQPPEDEAVAGLTTFPARRGIFGWAFQLGIHAFRCFCPCFHVRDHPHYHHSKLHSN